MSGLVQSLPGFFDQLISFGMRQNEWRRSDANNLRFEHRLGIPNRWDAAIDKFQRSKIQPQYLGKDYCKYFAMIRREESCLFHNSISQLDFDGYLRSVWIALACGCAATGIWPSRIRRAAKHTIFDTDGLQATH